MQIRSGGLGESRISVKPIARSVVVLHRDVHLRLRWNDNRPSGDHPENEKEKFHPMLYRDLSVNTDATLQEVALEISEQLNSLIWFRDDHIHCIRHETDFPLLTDYSLPVKEQRDISG